jgi:hypothetical protein
LQAIWWFLQIGYVNLFYITNYCRTIIKGKVRIPQQKINLSKG